jgi:ankyrin repeat protein
MEAAKNGDIDAMEAALKAGADVNTVHAATGRSVLHYAATSSSIAVQTLLFAGANPNHADDDGMTPFMAAVNAKMFANAVNMLDHGARIDFQETPGKISPLHSAIFCDNREDGGKCPRVEFLLRHDADPSLTMAWQDHPAISARDRAVMLGGERKQFERVFETYLSRNITAEFNDEASERLETSRNLSLIHARARQEAVRYKL